MRDCQVFGLFILVFIVIGTHAFPKSTLTGNHASISNPSIHHRVPRDIRMLTLKDPLDCLSQVICGLNTYPPEKPSVRTSVANDFAFLLKGAITKLRSQKPPTTTTTAAPIAKRTTPKASLNDDDDDDDDEEDDEEDSIENDVDYENERVDDYPTDPWEPPPVPIDRRRLKRSSIFNHIREKHKRDKLVNEGKLVKLDRETLMQILRPVSLTPLDRLRMETNLRAKLLSVAKCANGLIDHACPFNYQQMLSLISSSLEREKTVSYTTNKVLPMVGYLIKSRNYTGTLQATFAALERISNYTIEADKDGKPVDFSHILDEVMNRNTGDNGLRIVDTSNDSASENVWEDDEFDHVLQNPYVRQKVESGVYKLAEKKKQEHREKLKIKGTQLADKNNHAEAPKKNDDKSVTSEEDTSEEGLVFDRPRPPPRGPQDDESSSEEDDQNLEDQHSKVFEKVEKKPVKKFQDSEKENFSPPPVFGHLRKSAEDE